MEGTEVRMIEQNLLPFEFRIFSSPDYKTTAQAIKTMIVRGAGAIGATAGFGMAQAFMQGADADAARKEIEATRPTAVNLFHATERVYNAAKKSPDPKKAAAAEAQKVADEDAAACEMIGKHGEPLIKEGFRCATHCNAGWLAFVDWGSALSPFYAVHRAGKKIFVYADETRPRSQGARLTAWELRNEGVPHAIIPDNATAHYMQRGEIDIMITGADRVAANGDTANKIGTLEKAIVAKAFGVPFYIAIPTSTIDLKTKDWRGIPIEERTQDEVLYQTGPDGDGKTHKILVCSPGSSAKNPAFDVTPHKYIKGYITEKGILKANELKRIKN
jgi:S-methyl-5-thioribose-1-phosphate isomerase